MTVNKITVKTIITAFTPFLILFDFQTLAIIGNDIIIPDTPYEKRKPNHSTPVIEIVIYNSNDPIDATGSKSSKLTGITQYFFTISTSFSFISPPNLPNVKKNVDLYVSQSLSKIYSTEYASSCTGALSPRSLYSFGNRIKLRKV